MKEKYNFKIDSTTLSVSVKVAPAIFPTAVILRAAYHFIEENNVIIDEEEGKTLITFIPKKDSIKESDLEELGFEFNIQLISSFVEEEESIKHAGARDAMMRAALFSPPPIQRGPRPPQPPLPPSPQKQ